MDFFGTILLLSDLNFRLFVIWLVRNDFVVVPLNNHGDHRSQALVDLIEMPGQVIGEQLEADSTDLL